MAQDSFTLYGSFLSGPTYKVALMLGLCGIPFAYRHVDLAKGQHRTPEYLSINRFGQVPALVHDGRNLCQSDAILTYLAGVTGKFGGDTPGERQAIQEWLHWEVDRLYPGLSRTRFYTKFMKPEPPVMETYRKMAETALDDLNRLLGDRQWLVESGPSIADIACYAMVQQAHDGLIDLTPRRNVTAWCGRIEKLPGYKSWADALPKVDREAA